MSTRLLHVLLAALSLTCFAAGAQADELKLIKKGSKVSFVGGKPDGTTHAGGFKEFEVKATADFENPTKSSLNITINTASLWADDDKLANHLKSPDFFGVRKHPAITFESTEIVPKESDQEDGGLATIKGNLHMLGKKIAVDIPVKASVTEESIDLTAEFEIDRTQWGMTYGTGKINNEVKISVRFNMKR